MKCVSTVTVVLVVAMGLALAHAIPVSLQKKLHANARARGGPPPPDRSAEWGVGYVQQYDSQLPLPSDRAKAKQQLISSDPFVFFRATPALFHTDCAESKPHKERFVLNPKSRAPTITIGGDIHMANFGTFRGPKGDAVFGINDYDQSGNGVPDSDLTRLATSAVLAARNLKLPTTTQLNAITKIGAEYFGELTDCAKDGPKVPYLTEDKAKGKVKALIDDATKMKRSDFLDKYCTKPVNGQRRFTRGTELIDVKDSGLMTAIKRVLAQYKVIDVIEKLNSGGSSFGLPRYWALVVNPKDSAKDNVIVELKYLLPPSLVRGKAKANGPELIAAQRALNGYWNPITSSSNAVESSKAHYLIRETEPEKGSLNLAKLSADDLMDVVGQCAKVLARAHTAGGQKDKAAALLRWVSPVDQPMALSRLRDFAMKYADQVAADHAAYKAAI